MDAPEMFRGRLVNEPHDYDQPEPPAPLAQRTLDRIKQQLEAKCEKAGFRIDNVEAWEGNVRRAALDISKDPEDNPYKPKTGRIKYTLITNAKGDIIAAYGKDGLCYSVREGFIYGTFDLKKIIKK